MRARLVIATALACLLAASLVPGALASKPASGSAEPLTVARASLIQSAQQLVFKLRTTTPFSTVALRRQGRSLCSGTPTGRFAGRCRTRCRARIARRTVTQLLGQKLIYK